MTRKPVELGTGRLHPNNPGAENPAWSPDPPEAPPSGPATPLSPEEIKDKVVETLKTCYDPEIPVNIVELGLVYDLDVSDAGEVKIRMTLTTPACPVAGSLPGEIQAKVKAIPGVTAAAVDLVWDPPWGPDRMSEAARLELGFF
jgi:FeS assembly SUF system protein